MKKVPLTESPEFAKFQTWIHDAKRVLISTHSLPDGDGLGAETALYHYLKRGKKSCRIFNPDPLPKRYRFLDPKGTFLHGPGEAEMWDHCDLWIIVDTNDPRRLGKLWGDLYMRSKKIVFLDHHTDLMGVDEIKYPPHALVVADPDSSSIGELLNTLFQELNLAQLNIDVGRGLYVSVMTDTNSFRYARTTPKAHHIAGDMIALGVNPEETYQAIYSSKEVSHLQLLGKMLQSVQVAFQGKFAWFQMSQELRSQYRASADDTQSFLNLLLLLKDAEVVCFFREEDDGRVRFSMKSKGKLMINRLAMELGGGGHAYAAGAAIEGSLDHAVTLVTKKIEQLILSSDKHREYEL